MSGYEKGQIYKIVDVGFNLCYIGSTTEKLVKRFGRHRRHYRAYLLGTKDRLTVFKIFDTYGIENCKIYWIEDYPCKTKKELEAREGYWIQKTDCVNKRIEGRTKQQYQRDRRLELREYHNNYYHLNKKTICKPITCGCGTTYNRDHKARHEKCQKHQDWLKHQETEKELELEQLI